VEHYLSPSISRAVVEAYLPRQSFPRTRSRRGNAKCFNLSAKGNQPRTLPHFWEQREDGGVAPVASDAELDIHETASLVRYAIRHGLVQP